MSNKIESIGPRDEALPGGRFGGMFAQPVEMPAQVVQAQRLGQDLLRSGPDRALPVFAMRKIEQDDPWDIRPGLKFREFGIIQSPGVPNDRSAALQHGHRPGLNPGCGITPGAACARKPSGQFAACTVNRHRA